MVLFLYSFNELVVHMLVKPFVNNTCLQAHYHAGRLNTPLRQRHIMKYSLLVFSWNLLGGEAALKILAQNKM